MKLLPLDFHRQPSPISRVHFPRRITKRRKNFFGGRDRSADDLTCTEIESHTGYLAMTGEEDEEEE